ncbi:hypothetical protein TNCV_4584251 [Trichonephila clavipes]|nr:hypothetical protein TNCV_4584251 [Trichonephila clavipes]
MTRLPRVRYLDHQATTAARLISDPCVEIGTRTSAAKMLGIIHHQGLYGLGSNSGQDMDVCKYIVPSWRGGTLNSREAASPLVRLVAGDERREASDPPPGCSPSKLRWNRAKSYCHLYSTQGAMANDRRISSSLP